MAVNIGDKVRFLNATGGGVVKRFINKDLVEVEEEDGFDNPVLIRECVVVEPVGGQSKPTTTSQASSRQEVRKPPVEASPPRVVETREGDKLNVCLAFLPMEPKSLQNSNFEAYIVNDSNYFLQLSYLNKSANSWNLRYSGLIEPNQKVFLEEFSKEELDDLKKINIQFVSFKQGKVFELKNPVSVEYKLDTVKFYKLHSFRDNDYFDEEALIYPVVKNDIPERQIQVSAEELEFAMKEKSFNERRQPQLIQKKLSNQILEIDLHINNLLDNTAGLNNADMLQYQMAKFHEVMTENLKIKGRKIVFIHGKGEGTLRKSIIDELKAKYKSCTYQDASFREYGFGATMVTIK
jgi:Mismatch repair ATPase (MutS family)